MKVSYQALGGSSTLAVLGSPQPEGRHDRTLLGVIIGVVVSDSEMTNAVIFRQISWLSIKMQPMLLHSVFCSVACVS